MVGFRGGGGNRRRTHTRLIGEHSACHAVADDRTDSAAGHGLRTKRIGENQFDGRHQHIGINRDNGNTAYYIKHCHGRHDKGRGFGDALNAAQKHDGR